MQGQIGEIFNLAAFAERLKKTRKNDGQTLKEFAARIGVALATYQHYEGAKRKPNIEFIMLLARATGRTTDYWLGVASEEKLSIESASTNNALLIQAAEAVIECADEMKNAIGERISKLKIELHKMEK